MAALSSHQDLTCSWGSHAHIPCAWELHAHVRVGPCTRTYTLYKYASRMSRCDCKRFIVRTRAFIGLYHFCPQDCILTLKLQQNWSMVFSCTKKTCPGDNTPLDIQGSILVFRKVHLVWIRSLRRKETST